MRICVVTSPRAKASVVPILNLMDILTDLSTSLYLITGNEGATVCKERKNIQGYSLEYQPQSLPLARICAYILLQMRISYEIVKLRNRVDLFIFLMGEGLLLPMLTIKLIRRRVILNLASSTQQYFETHTDRLSRIIMHIEPLCYTLADRIIVYSPNVIKAWGLEKHKAKISIAHKHFLDFDKLTITEHLSKRQNLVGYIGRFSYEKGTMNFIKAIPEILSQNHDLGFFVGGDGDLSEEMKNCLDEAYLSSKTDLPGWISHDMLPFYLNKLRLLVLPSHTEGLPNIMLEAMACGTPVLATPVGSIPDVIKDGETGFIMENNAPDCIARNVVRALNHPCLEKIVSNAREMVEREFAYDIAVEQYEKCLASLD